MDGQIILALILKRLQPHYKVAMYSEIGIIKKMTVAQFDNDIDLFCDSVKGHGILAGNYLAEYRDSLK